MSSTLSLPKDQLDLANISVAKLISLRETELNNLLKGPGRKDRLLILSADLGVGKGVATREMAKHGCKVAKSQAGYEFKPFYREVRDKQGNFKVGNLNCSLAVFPEQTMVVRIFGRQVYLILDHCFQMIN